METVLRKEKRPKAKRDIETVERRAQRTVSVISHDPNFLVIASSRPRLAEQAPGTKYDRIICPADEEHQRGARLSRARVGPAFRHFVMAPVSRIRSTSRQ
jgi:hypothetical protein